MYSNFSLDIIPEKNHTCHPELSDGVFGPVPSSQGRVTQKIEKSKHHRRKKRIKKSTSKSSDCAVGKNLINHGVNVLEKSVGNQLNSNIEELSILGKTTSMETIPTQEIGIVRSRWDSSDSDADTTAVASQGILTPVNSKSPIDGKVTSGVLGMDKLLALSLKHKSKSYSVKRSFKKKKRKKRDHKSASYSERCLRSPLQKKPHLQQNNTRKRISLVSDEEKSCRHNHNTRERSEAGGSESIEKRSSHSSSISSYSNYSRHQSRRYSSNSISSRSSISISPHRNLIRSNTESSNDSWSNNYQQKQQQDVNLDEGYSALAKQSLSKKPITHSSQIVTDKVKKYKRKKSGLSWQPPLEFGDDDEEGVTENLILKKDLEKLSKNVCSKKDVSIKKDLSSKKNDSTENDVSSMKDITLNRDRLAKTDGTFDESNGIQFHMKNSSPNKEEMKKDVTENPIDLDTIDEMLFTLDKKTTVVRSNRSKLELRKRISLLQKSNYGPHLGEPVVDDSNSHSDSPKKEVNNNNLVSPIKILEIDGNNVRENNNATVKFPGGIKEKVDVLSPTLTGFGFIPKYQPKFSPIHHVEMEQSPVKVTVAKVCDVGGIWSDDETDKTSQNELQLPDSKTLSIMAEASSQKFFSEPSFKTTTSTTSTVECINNQSEIKVTEIESSGEDDELLLHGPLPPPKKPIKFNIKLPKPESSDSIEKKAKKKRSKKRKKDRVEEEENVKLKKTKTIELPIESTVSPVKVSDNPPILPVPNVKLPASSSNLPVRVANQNQTANAMYMRQQMSMYSHQSQFFNPIYHQHYVYQQMQYASAQMQQFMQFTTNNHPPLPMESTSLDEYPPLPASEELPPLPAESQQPPEPVTDTKRLNDTVVTAMLYADPTDGKLSKLFNNASDDPSLPSPASSRSPSRSRSRRKKRRHNKRSSRWKSRSPSSSSSSSSSSYFSSRSSGGHRRSRSSSYDTSRSRSRHHRRHQSYSSDSSSRSSDSLYSSDDRSDRRRSRSFLRYTSSSRSLRDRSTSWSSGGSDLDRPCRHFRRRLAGSKEFSETSSRATSRSSWSGRSWSRGRSLSRSRSSSRYSRSSYYSD